MQNSFKLIIKFGFFALSLALTAQSWGSDALCESNQTLVNAYIQKDLPSLTKEIQAQNLSNNQYAEIAYLSTIVALALNQKGTAKKFLADGIEKIEKENNGRAFALKSLLLGQRIRMKPYLGIFLGSTLEKHLHKAEDLLGSGALLNYTMGAYYHHTPKKFGGNTDNARHHYEEAFLNESASSDCWVIAISGVQLISVYLELELFTNAKLLREKYNKRFPSNRWAPEI